MKQNAVQFPKGFDLNAFLESYGTEVKCVEALFKLRRPNSFICPHCCYNRNCHFNTRKLCQFNRCHRQTSIITGTFFESS